MRIIYIYYAETLGLYKNRSQAHELSNVPILWLYCASAWRSVDRHTHTHTVWNDVSKSGISSSLYYSANVEKVITSYSFMSSIESQPRPIGIIQETERQRNNGDFFLHGFIGGTLKLQETEKKLKWDNGEAGRLIMGSSKPRTIRRGETSNAPRVWWADHKLYAVVA